MTFGKFFDMSSLLFAYFSPGAGVGGREEEAGGGGGQDGYLVPRGCRHEKGLPRVFLFLVHFTDFSKVYNTRLFIQYSDHVPVVYFRTPPSLQLLLAKPNWCAFFPYLFSL